ncbi:MAG: YbaB/EbfC family nucleoid-associated protein [Chloroflexi bacterium]|nr:YbaB/EbfC family nucleoid-associated protein [Chloroflexota bacterium]
MNPNLMRQARELEAKLAKAQQELEKATVEASTGGGAVKIVITGQQKVLKVSISTEAVDPSAVDLLEDLVLTAVNDAIARSQELAKQKLGSVAGFKLPF